MNLREKNFIIDNPSEANLRDKRFVLLKDVSTPAEKYYMYTFPVYKVHGKELMYCELVVGVDDNRVDMSVYSADGSIYGPWYKREFSKGNRVVEQVDQAILGKISKLGITEAEKPTTSTKMNKKKDNVNDSKHSRRVPKVRTQRDNRDQQGENQSEMLREE